MRWLTSVVLGLCVTGCLQAGDVPCGDHVCPQNTTCDKATGLCVPALCGNDRLDGTEECDGVPDTEDCTDHGFYVPDGLTCSPVCTLDTTECKGFCGDHLINGPETCDGIPPAGVGCADFGFDVGQLGCSGACTPAFNACAPIGWAPMPGGATNELHAVAATPRTQIAVGYAGTIIENVDGTWLPMASPTQRDLYGVWLLPGIGAAPDTGYAVGDHGTILAFDGSTWTDISNAAVIDDLRAVSGANASTVYAVGAGGTILELAAGSWVRATSGTSNLLNGVFAGTLSAYAVGNDSTVLVRALNGTWSPFPVAFPFAVQHLNNVSGADGVVFVAGTESNNAGLVAKFESGSWTKLPAPQLYVYYGLYASSSTDVWATGTTGAIVHYDGITALTADTGTSRTIYGVTALGPAGALSVTRGGEVLGYNGTSRTTTTNLMRSMVDATLVPSQSATLPNEVLAVGGAAGLLHFDGMRWTSVSYTDSNLPLTANMTTVFADATRVVAGAGSLASGATGGTFISTDRGATFNQTSTTSVSDITGVAGEYYAAADNAIYRSTNGTSWTQVAAPPASLYGIWGAPDGSAFFAVGEKTITVDGELVATSTIYRGKGTSWTEEMSVPRGPRLNAVWGTSASNVYAVGSVGAVLHYDGARWRSMYTGTGENFTTVGGTSPQDVFIGGPGIRFHFDGVTWSRMSNPAFRDTASIAVGPRPPARSDVYFVGGFFGAEVLGRACTPAEVRCEDPWDNDCDGLTNCADNDCMATLACARGGACETTVRLECGTTIDASTYTGIARIDDLPCLDISTPGPEASFRFLGESNRQVTVTLADATDDLELVVTGGRPGVGPGAGSCDLASCTAGTPSSGGTSVTFTEAPGDLRFLVVDGPLSTAHDFTLTVDCQ